MSRVAEIISKHAEEVGTVNLVWIHGTNRPPLLQLQPPKGKKVPRFQVHLHFGMKSIEWIPRLRLVPNRANVKEKGPKAQFYNHCLLYDARHQFENVHVQQLLDHKSCQEALVLLQVWALQRGLWRNHDGWDKTSVALLMVYLLRTNKMNPRMTPIQLFTVVLQTWATTNWLGEREQENQTSRVAQGQDVHTHVREERQRTVLILPEDGESEGETARSADLAILYAKQTEESPLSTDDPRTLLDAYAWTHRYLLGPVFMDPSMSYNYLGGVSPNYMKLLSWQARKSLEALSNSRSAFDILFMRRARFWQQWDLYVRIPTNYKGSGEDWEFSVRHLLQKLEWGLGNRVHGTRILSNGNGESTGATPDTDQYTEESVRKQQKQLRKHCMHSPTGTDDIIVGVSINQETSQRVVDRGPPPEQHEDVQHFLKLWGTKAQLRRFKDGAIVQAVVWNEDKERTFHNGDKWNGGYVEKIIRHLLHVHHATAKVTFSFPSLLSTIDDIARQDDMSTQGWDPLSAHQRATKAFEGLSDFLRRNTEQPTPGQLQTSSLGLPLSIDAVEPLSPTLRYSELFPPQPHPLLGGPPNAEKRVSGAIMFDPILVQIRFGASSKWPTDLKAIGAAKTAMLIQLANGIEKSGDKDFDGVVNVCPTYADIGYRGYCFRIIVRADPEIHMLQRLVTPSPAASQLLKDLTLRHILASRHHSTIHAVHTLHPSAPSVVRLARRWSASHLLSGHLTTELIELLVASVYSDDSVFVQPPATVAAGFFRFLQLLATSDWARYETH
jgi:U3 small nucleolar RNA-associated protein 22